MAEALSSIVAPVKVDQQSFEQYQGHWIADAFSIKLLYRVGWLHPPENNANQKQN